jgi:hypothetical protein
MATLPTVCTAFAARVRTVIPYTAYPAPTSINVVPMAIVYGAKGAGGSFKGGSEQEHLEVIHLQIFAGTMDTPSALLSLDELVDPLIDLFDADDVVKHTLSGLVDSIGFPEWEFGTTQYGNQPFFGGVMRFPTKRRRFAGDS